MNGFFACMSLCTTCVPGVHRGQSGCGISRTWAMDDSGTLCECWESARILWKTNTFNCWVICPVIPVLLLFSFLLFFSGQGFSMQYPWLYWTCFTDQAGLDLTNIYLEIYSYCPLPPQVLQIKACTTMTNLQFFKHITTEYVCVCVYTCTHTHKHIHIHTICNRRLKPLPN